MNEGMKEWIFLEEGKWTVRFNSINLKDPLEWGHRRTAYGSLLIWIGLKKHTLYYITLHLHLLDVSPWYR